VTSIESLQSPFFLTAETSARIGSPLPFFGLFIFFESMRSSPSVLLL
jgi:hypothetical protein